MVLARHQRHPGQRRRRVHRRPRDAGLGRTALLGSGRLLRRPGRPGCTGWRCSWAGNAAENPTDDLTSALVNADVDGEHLTAQELGSFFILLVVAGQRDHPERALARAEALHRPPRPAGAAAEDFERNIAGAVERDRPLRDPGHPVPPHPDPGPRDERPLLPRPATRSCCSTTPPTATRACSPTPTRFDITRVPNPHVGFGGPGPHFCLGAHLARREMTVMFRELFARAPDIRSRRRTGPAALQLHQRDQAPPLRNHIAGQLSASAARLWCHEHS